MSPSEFDSRSAAMRMSTLREKSRREAEPTIFLRPLEEDLGLVAAGEDAVVPNERVRWGTRRQVSFPAPLPDLPCDDEDRDYEVENEERRERREHEECSHGRASWCPIRCPFSSICSSNLYENTSSVTPDVPGPGHPFLRPPLAHLVNLGTTGSAVMAPSALAGAYGLVQPKLTCAMAGKQAASQAWKHQVAIQCSAVQPKECLRCTYAETGIDEHRRSWVIDPRTYHGKLGIRTSLSVVGPSLSLSRWSDVVLSAGCFHAIASVVRPPCASIRLAATE